MVIFFIYEIFFVIIDLCVGGWCRGLLATAADIVADPSAPDAFVDGVMEGKEWVWEGSILREKQVEQVKSTINTLVDQKKLEEHKLALFSKFLRDL